MVEGNSWEDKSEWKAKDIIHLYIVSMTLSSVRNVDGLESQSQLYQ